MAKTLRYEVLGPLRVLGGDKELPLGGLQRRKVLGLLLSADGRTVSVDRLIDGVWPNDPPAKARRTIQQYVHHLRAELGDALTTEPGGYALHTGGNVDAIEFEALLDRAEQLSPRERARCLNDALQLWRGEPYAEFESCEWATPLVARLDELRGSALQDRADALIVSGEPVKAAALMRTYVETDPFNDRPQGLLMRALASQGRTTEALRVFQNYRDHLGATAGTEPSAELRDLDRKIASGWRDHIGETAPEHGSNPGSPESEHDQNTVSHDEAERRLPRDNLGGELNSFVHRPEVARLVEMVETRRLVTIVGPGGIGKSRSASAVGRAVLEDPRRRERWVDGVWFVDLSAADGAADGWNALVDALGLIRGDRSLADTVLNYLRERNALLLLDNCEHLLAWVTEVVADLLASAPGISMLATSRVRLDSPAERVFELEPMSELEALQLFETRVTEMGAGPFPIDEAIALCALLDYYPLAVELAAGRSRTLSAAEMIERLADHPDLLRRSSGNQRHRTLSATLDWSLAQLGSDDRSILQQAAIFSSDFDLAAAEAILVTDNTAPSAVLEHLDALVEHHLVGRDHRRARFRILEPIRQALKADAPASSDLVRRHGEYYMALMADVGMGLLTPQQGSWWIRFHDDLVNIRDAIKWAIADDEASLVETAMRWMPPQISNLLITEVAEWAFEALDTFACDPTMLPATALTAATGWHLPQGAERCEALLTTLEESGVEPGLETMLHFVRSSLEFMMGNPTEAFEAADRCLEIATANDEQTMIALAAVARMQPAGVPMADSLGVPSLRCYSRFGTYGYMDAAAKLNALPMMTEAYEAAVETQSQFCVAVAESVLASVYLRRGDLDQGVALMRQGCEGMLRFRSHYLVRHVVETVANGLAAAAVSFPAAVLWATMDTSGAAGLARNYRDPILPGIVAADLTTEQLAEARAQGAAMTMEQASAYALDVLTTMHHGEDGGLARSTAPGDLRPASSPGSGRT